jgi:hypothetical protein
MSAFGVVFVKEKKTVVGERRLQNLSTVELVLEQSNHMPFL